MSKCNISIELDRDPMRIPAGGLLQGVVSVEVNAPCVCRGLELVLGWHTHGRGNRVSKEVAVVELFRGDWAFGERASYPFSIELPEAPLSYQGHLFNVDWFLRAHAEIPWASDPNCERNICVIAGEAPSSAHPSAAYPMRLDRLAEQRKENDGEVSSAVLLFALTFFSIGGFLIHQGLTDGDILRGIVVVPMGLAFASMALLMAYATLRNRMAAMRLGKVEVDWPEGPVHTGEKVPIRLGVDAAKGLNAFNATLFCRETVITGSGDDERTHHHDIFHAPVPLSRSQQTGERVGVEGVLEIPQDAAPSFYARDNEVFWLLEVHIDVAGSPDWMRKYYLDVRSGVAQLEAPQPLIEPRIDAEDDFAQIMEQTEAW